jgi:hypothetical protein
MSCERFREALTELSAGGPASAGLESHLAACADCRRELLAPREAPGPADTELRMIATAEPLPLLQARIRRAVAQVEAPAPMALPWLWPATAAALVLVAMAAGLWRVRTTVPPSGIAAATPATASTPPSTSEPSAASRVARVPPRGVEPSEGSPRGGGLDRRRPNPRRRIPPEPEVLVPPGQQESLLRFVVLVQREQLAPRSLMAAGEPSADLVEPKALQIQPLEIVPLDPAESSGT